jgi:hypothetical protein
MRPGVFWVMGLSPDLKVVTLRSDDRAPSSPVRTVKSGQSIPVLFSELLQCHLYYTLLFVLT